MLDEVLQAAGTDPFTVHALLLTKEFWSALAGAFAGAIAAFALGAFAQWRARANARRAIGNLAIVTLAEMYSEAKGYYEATFLRPFPELQRLLGRSPLFFEYKAALDPPSEMPQLNIEQLGFLADGNDPDVLMRLVAVKNDYRAMLKLAAAHARLHAELQARMAKVDPTGRTPYRAEEIPWLIGADVIMQLRSTVEGLQDMLPELTRSLELIRDQLRDALLYALPSHSFVKFIPEKRGKLSEAAVIAIKPAAWRRVVRWLRGRWDRLFGRKWPVPSGARGERSTQEPEADPQVPPP